MRRLCYRDDKNCRGSDCVAWDQKRKDCVFVLEARAKLIEPPLMVWDTTGETKISVECTSCAELEDHFLEVSRLNQELIVICDHWKSCAEQAREDLAQSEKSNVVLRVELKEALEKLQEWRYRSQRDTGRTDPKGMGDVLHGWRNSINTIAEIVGSRHPSGPRVVEDVRKLKTDLDESWGLLNSMIKMYMPYFPVDKTYADPDQGLGVVLQELTNAKGRIVELENEIIDLKAIDWKKATRRARQHAEFWQEEAEKARRWSGVWKKAAKEYRAVSRWPRKEKELELEVHKLRTEVQDWKGTFMDESETSKRLLDNLTQAHQTLQDERGQYRFGGATLADRIRAMEQRYQRTIFHLEHSLEACKAAHRLHHAICPYCGVDKENGSPCPVCDREGERCTGCFDPMCDGWREKE